MIHRWLFTMVSDYQQMLSKFSMKYVRQKKTQELQKEKEKEKKTNQLDKFSFLCLRWNKKFN